MSYPKKGSSELTIPIKPEKNQSCELRLQVLVAARSASLQFMVFEKT